MAPSKPTLLIILDGFGLPSAGKKETVVTAKNMPNFFSWWKKFPHAELIASGEAVGLFKGQEGNSEAGHLNLGAGRVVKQDARYISDAIADGTFYKNGAFRQAAHHLKKYNTAAHVVGLLSNHNSAHSSPEHLYALLEFLAREKITKVYLHLFTDGRDSGTHDAIQHLKKLEQHLRGSEHIASMMGRLYGMDRNKIWNRIKSAYEAVVIGRGMHQAPTALAALEQGYNRGETDEFIQPTVIPVKGRLVTIANNDAVFFFNLRSDRAREFTKAVVQPDFEKINPGAFKRERVPKNIRFVAMTDFGPDLPGVLTAFPSRDIPNSLVVALCPRRQLYIAESEKFAHITYFFNGGYAQHFCDEEWVKIASARVADFDGQPAMQATAIADRVVQALEKENFEFIAVNFANADMIGHTGNATAAQEAVRVLDRELGRVIDALLRVGGNGLLTADHGNIEQLIDKKTGEVDTEHSTNPVPCIIFAPKQQLSAWKLATGRKLPGAKLANVAPTILKMMGLAKPKEMSAKTLF